MVQLYILQHGKFAAVAILTLPTTEDNTDSPNLLFSASSRDISPSKCRIATRQARRKHAPHSSCLPCITLTLPMRITTRRVHCRTPRSSYSKTAVTTNSTTRKIHNDLPLSPSKRLPMCYHLPYWAPPSTNYEFRIRISDNPLNFKKKHSK